MNHGIAYVSEDRIGQSLVMDFSILTSRGSSFPRASACRPPLARAMEQAGLFGKVKLTGLAPATLIKKYIQNDTVQDIWWNVKDLGYLTYYAAQAVAWGQITGKEGETFKVGRLGEYTVGPGGEVVVGPAKIVTPANVEEFKFYAESSQPSRQPPPERFPSTSRRDASTA
jgi:hypothetical protein